MPSQPTAKPKRRTSLEDYLWPIFVAACGNCCVACNETGIALQRGHVQRHADDGAATFDNLMPLCGKCNGKNNQHFNMPDTRPNNWRTNFLKLLAHNMGLKLVVNRGVHPSTENGRGVQGLATQNFPDSKEVIGWEQVIFETDSELYTPLPIHPSPPPLEEILATIQELVRKGTKWSVAIPPPKEKCQDKLKRLVAQHGRKDFLAAGVEYLRQELWFDSDGYRVDRDPWQTFADNFTMYLAEAEEQVRRKAKREAEDWEKLKRDRWVTYLGAGKVTWPEMTDADREFVDGVKNLSGEPQAVSDEDYQCAKDILDRYRVFANRKQTLVDLVNKTLGRMEIDLNDQDRVDLFYRLRELGSKVAAVKDINDPKLAAYYAEVMPLLRSFAPLPVNPFSQ